MVLVPKSSRQQKGEVVHSSGAVAMDCVVVVGSDFCNFSWTVVTTNYLFSLQIIFKDR